MQWAHEIAVVLTLGCAIAALWQRHLSVAEIPAPTAAAKQQTQQLPPGFEVCPWAP
jgi:hypothetical protein